MSLQDDIDTLITGDTTDEDLIKYVTKIRDNVKTNFDECSKVGEGALKQNEKTKLLADSLNFQTNAKYAREVRTKLLAISETNIKTLDDLEKDIEKYIQEIKRVTGTASDAALALQELMNDDTFNKIVEIEKQIGYRRFYFPGGPPKLRIAGKGIDTDNVEYDGIVDGSSFDTWDPRYFPEYIALAKQRGFHRYFIIWNGSDFETIDIGVAATYLKNCVDWVRGTITLTGGCDKNYIVGVIAGLVYFDKLDVFVEESGLTINKTVLSRLRTNNNDLISPAILKLANGLIKQSEKRFKEDNIGWTSMNDNRFAFDSSELNAEWLKLQDDYNKTKDRVWTLLSDIEALNLCMNKVNTMGNNIQVNQSVNCIQNVVKEENKTIVENVPEEPKKEEPKVEEPKAPETPAAPKQDVPKQEPPKQDVPKQEPSKPDPPKPAAPKPEAPKPEAPKQETPKEQPKQKPKEKEQPKEEPNEDEEEPVEEDKTKTYIIIASVVAGIIIFIIILLLIFKRPPSMPMYQEPMNQPFNQQPIQQPFNQQPFAGGILDEDKNYIEIQEVSTFKY